MDTFLLLGVGNHLGGYFRHCRIVDCSGDGSFNVSLGEGGDHDFGCCCDFVHILPLSLEKKA
jgi:hypothetical protein